jgi:hypothetical protein
MGAIHTGYRSCSLPPHDNGADFFATPDRRLIKGGPFSTLESSYVLAELGLDPGDSVLSGAEVLIWAVYRRDGRFQLAPNSAIYPCHTAHAAKTLCYLALPGTRAWSIPFRTCWKRSIETEAGAATASVLGSGRNRSLQSGPTLTALDAFRFTPFANSDARLDRAAEFCLVTGRPAHRSGLVTTALERCFTRSRSRF